MRSEIDGVGATDLVYNEYTGEYETYEKALKRKMDAMWQKERFT